MIIFHFSYLNNVFIYAEYNETVPGTKINIAAYSKKLNILSNVNDLAIINLCGANDLNSNALPLTIINIANSVTVIKENVSLVDNAI
ncbi:hypothetical protein JAJEKKNP_00046 [Lumpy skin disease virus]|nr:hypothetical protein JAJEKKNP_00046 [Lumpy skin disease virus]